MAYQDLLKQYWGYDHFRPKQEEIIHSILSGRDTLALLPTGGGKSLCYQLPAMAKEGLTLVISPLIALMKDQVRQLRKRHIKAYCIVAGMSRHEIDLIINHCLYDDTKLLYVSPERLQSQSFLAPFREMKVSMIAVDEAHCISQWGYDFRPPYLEIARIRQYHPNAPVLALTATATPEVVRDIQERLDFRNGAVFQGSFFRENLSYSVFHEDDKPSRLLKIAQNVGGCGIVYVRNRKRTIEVAQFLDHHGIDAAAYHAGINIKERDARQQAWQQSGRSVMVATNAFGMGIDKPDVRFVVHLDIPESPEAYFQEAGRAGRDGKKAYAILLYNEEDIRMLDYSLQQNFPSQQFIRNAYQGICNFYQIPVGAGQDCQYEFRFEEICHSYGFNNYAFYSALRFLEREGLLALSEHEGLQSKLYIPVHKEELYRYQLAHPREGDLLANILRMYGGLFSDFTPVNEGQIARRCNLSETKVCNLLSEMHKQKIVEYQKRSLAPPLILTSPRIDSKDLYISDKNYKALKDNAQRRQQAMLDYIANNEECRSRQLLHYFGENESAACGLCDVCVGKKSKKAPSPEELEHAILSLLAAKPMTIRELSLKMTTTSHDDLAAAVRKLMDRKKIRMDQNLCMSCDNS